MTAEQQMAMIRSMQDSTKEAEQAAEAAIKKAEDDAALLRENHQVYEQNAVAYKLAQQQLISASEEAKAALEEERRRSARAVDAADEAAEAERAKERARFGQSMKGLSRVMTMGLDGPDMLDMDEIREMLLVMVEGGDPMAKVRRDHFAPSLLLVRSHKWMRLRRQ